MLVLTRKVGEEIVIAGEIRVTVTAIAGNKVRIGVSAPLGIDIDRAEIHARRQQFDTLLTLGEQEPALGR